ncbi:LysR family transcriptional regulator [Gluconobacter kanchanaburiensis]|nr:LysR family transcriptional regulator [Gluconobacter kanchanaburiensis]
MPMLSYPSMSEPENPRAEAGHDIPQKNEQLIDRLDWNLLRTFIAIAHEGNITRAAGSLHLTQSAVSQALKRLEKQIGYALIVRNGSRFTLSSHGEKVLRLASDIYGSIKAISNEIEPVAEEVGGHIRLLTLSSIESLTYDTFLARFHERFPRISLEIVCIRSEDILSSLQKKTANIGIGLCPRALPGIGRSLIMEQSYGLYCGRSHRFFGRNDITIRELKQENFVRSEADRIDGLLSKITIFRNEMDFSGWISGTSCSIQEITRMIVANYGIGCLPEHIAQPWVDAGKLWRLPPASGVAKSGIFLLWNHDGRYSNSERVFLEQFQSYLQAYPPISDEKKSGPVFPTINAG